MALPYRVPLNLHVESNGSLAVIEESSSFFPLRRVFVVTADVGQVRGHHAHKTCSQLLVVLRGQVLVSVDGGNGPQDFLVSQLDQGLLIPPMNWATQKYMNEETILMVVCDELFDEKDYIREYEEFNIALHLIEDENNTS
ncbi:MAG: FdtA/QdtA family cupin domain-containing protein [Candidatus Nanopelagicales bacterium]|nr:FdtA/QdtA family cupin domain-containing protein [Candidatus Nanopelagicales bacterium]